MDTIMNALKKIEEKERIRILYACETGSRAWGFPSPDSDYDVRFVYIRERDWYLSLGQKKDTLECMDGELDITGWDLDKSLLLLSKSNAALIERFQSPVYYLKEENFYKDIKSLIAEHYSPIAVFFHHYSLARNLWHEMKGKKEIKLKKYFYVIRSLLSCYWAAHRDDVLPMHLEGLLQIWDEDSKAMLRQMVQVKSGVGEQYVYECKPAETEWIENLWRNVEGSKDKLSVAKGDFKTLESYFIKTVNAYADN